MRKTIWKRTLCLLLALALLCVLLPQTAPSAQAAYSGTCGDNLTWTFDPDTGTLTIEGSGNMSNYGRYPVAPWNSYRYHITTVSLPDGLTSIGDFAFDFCKQLTSIDLPEGLISIGEYAFIECSRLSSISIPASVCSIKGSAFAYCTSITRFSLAEGNTAFSVDADGVLYNADGSELVSYPRGKTDDYSIPQTVTAVSAGAFSGCRSLNSVTIPQGVATIGCEAFLDTGLQTVQLPASITDIEEDAFDSCEDLRGLYNYSRTCSIGSSIYTLGNPNATTLFGYPGSTTESFAARNHYRFVNIESYNSGTCGENGGDNLLWYFDENTNTLQITGSGNMENYFPGSEVPWIYYIDQIHAISLPDGMTSIGARAFSNLRNVTSADIPDGVTRIEADAFYGCSGLCDVSLPENLICLSGGAFGCCGRLTSITLPSSLTEISPDTFKSCVGLTEVELPDGLTTICSSAFSGCGSLAEIVFPASLETIGDSAFLNCAGLRSVVFSEGLKTIENSVFSGCESLEAVTLPKTLEQMGSNVFLDCGSLRQVVFRNPETQILSHYYSAYLQQLPGDTEEDIYYDPEWYVYSDTDYPTSLGIPEKAIIYGVHDPDIENAPAVEVVSGSEDDGWIIKETRTYPENYAKTFGYTFYATNMFDDVAEGRWYEIPVAWAYGRGITTGTGEGLFSPNATCTREQIVTFIWKAYDSPEPGGTTLPFTDVKPGRYYEDAVRWAYYHEPRITSGVDETTFGVGQSCTRGQVVTFLWNAAGKPEPESADNPFMDVKESDYFYKAVLWAVENGITSGVSPTSFGPKQTCTRAQVVTVLYKAVG